MNLCFFFCHKATNSRFLVSQAEIAGILPRTSPRPHSGFLEYTYYTISSSIWARRAVKLSRSADFFLALFRGRMVLNTVPPPRFPPGTLPWILLAGLTTIGLGTYASGASTPIPASSSYFQKIQLFALELCLKVLKTPEKISLVFYSAIAFHVVESISALIFIRHKCGSKSIVERKTFIWCALVLLIGFPVLRELIKAAKAKNCTEQDQE